MAGPLPSELFDLHGKVSVIVGGTGGLGSAMAAALAQAGSKVAILGRNEQRGSDAARSIAESSRRALGTDVLYVACDALERESLEAANDVVDRELGAVDILVNAAGGNRPDATLPPGSDFNKLAIDAWQNVFDLNLTGGVVLPVQVFAAKMLSRSAPQGDRAASCSIINIASMSGMIPLSRVVAYSAAKAAVLNLTMFLAREWATKGIRVNAISPGFFPAEQNRTLLYNADGTLSTRGSQIIGHTPMGRFGVPEELAGAIVFLASSRASGFVTGQNIVIDGGFSSTTI